MISFNIGGVPDIVRPGVTGYLAEPENVEDFCDGIVQLLEDEALRNQLSEQCRTIALKEYRHELMVQRYIRLYSQLLQNEMVEEKDELVSQHVV
jgi:glycosyltransferase involved in cell wall biosynthesis